MAYDKNASIYSILDGFDARIAAAEAGSTAPRIGGLWAGQSILGYMLAKDTDATTITGAGATISRNTRVLASYANSGAPEYMPAVDDMVWGAPSDAGPYNSAGVAAASYYIEKFANSAGYDFVAHAVGNTSILTWQPGQPNFERMIANAQKAISLGAVLDHVVFMNGHRSATDGMTEAAFKSALDTFFAGVKDRIPSITKMYLYTVGWINSPLGGSFDQLRTVREGGTDWCETNGQVYVTSPDVALKGDGTHELQVGAVAIGLQFARAIRPALGRSGSNVGPTIASVDRTTTLGKAVISFDMAAGATALVSTGNFSPRIQVFQEGSTTTRAFSTTGLVVGDTTITIDDGAPSTAIDIYIDADPQSGPTDGSSAIVRDDHIEADEAAIGITVGRTIAPSVVPFSVPAVAGDAGYTIFEFTNTLNGNNRSPGNPDYRWGCPELLFLDENTPIANTGASASGASVSSQPPSRLVDGSLAADFSTITGEQIVVTFASAIDPDRVRFKVSVDGGVGDTWTGGTVHARKAAGGTRTLLGTYTGGGYSDAGQYVEMALAR